MRMKRAVTMLALVAITASSSFADEHFGMTTYMGVGVHTDGGSWQEVDGRLAQTDASVEYSVAFVPAGIQGKAEYSFDVSYVGGLEDNYIGFGVVVPSFAMGLVWDPATFGGSGLRAQVYNEDGEIHEYGGVTYDMEIPAATIAGITTEMVMNTPLTVRIRIDSSNGNVWVKDPFDATTWWAFTLGQSLEGEGHNMIGVGTTSAAAAFGDFFATPLADSFVPTISNPVDCETCVAINDVSPTGLPVDLHLSSEDSSLPAVMSILSGEFSRDELIAGSTVIVTRRQSAEKPYSSV